MSDVLMAGPEAEPDDDISTDVGLVERVKKHWKLARDHSDKWRQNAKVWFDYRDGEQWDEADKQTLQEQLRPIVTFNRIAPILDAVAGQEVQNRQEVRYIPRTEGDVQKNELLTGAAEWVRDLCDAEDEETDAFTDMLACGMAWTETRMDYEEDLDGQGKIERVDPFEMFWDPFAKKRNLSDRAWNLRLKDISKEDFDAFWPGKRDQLVNTVWDKPLDQEMAIEGDANEPDEYATASEMSFEGHRKKNTVRVAHYEWWEREAVYRVVLNNQVQEIEPILFNRLKERFDIMGVRYLQQTRKVYKKAMIAGETVLERSDKGENAYPMKGFTFNAMTAKRDQRKNTWYGLVKPMVDPQQWANKFFSQIQNILATNAKGGVMAESDAVQNVRDFESNWARSDGVVYMKPGAISKGKVMPKPQVAYPQGLDRLMEFAIRAHYEVTGVSLELMGMTDRNQPGYLEYQRRQSGMAILSPYFDALRRYRKEQGRTLLHLIQQYMSDGRLIRITLDEPEQGQPADQYVPLDRTDESITYDIIIDEAPTSPNQKEKTFAIMQDLLPTMASMNIPPPPSFLDHSPLPAKVAQEWKEMMQPGDIPPEIQEQMEEMQAAMEELETENEELKRDQEVKMAKVEMEKEIAAHKQILAERELEFERAEGEEKMHLEKEIAAAKANLERDEQRHKEEIASKEIALARWKAGQEMAIKRQAAKSNGATR